MMGKEDLDQDELKKRYKCSLGDGGWCDGTKRGKAMRCPAHSLTVDGGRICSIGIERGLNEMMEMD